MGTLPVIHSLLVIIIIKKLMTHTCNAILYWQVTNLASLGSAHIQVWESTQQAASIMPLCTHAEHIIAAKFHITPFSAHRHLPIISARLVNYSKAHSLFIYLSTMAIPFIIQGSTVQDCVNGNWQGEQEVLSFKCSHHTLLQLCFRLGTEKLLRTTEVIEMADKKSFYSGVHLHTPLTIIY